MESMALLTTSSGCLLKKYRLVLLLLCRVNQYGHPVMGNLGKPISQHERTAGALDPVGKFTWRNPGKEKGMAWEHAKFTIRPLRAHLLNV
jgi:hypothetical protein